MTINKIARWDKLKRWSEVKQEIQERLSNEEKGDDSITLDIGPQLLYTLRHPSALRCMEHTESKLGDVFTCHYNKGAVQGVRVWLIQNKDKNGAAKNIGFETDYEITSMTYVTKHRVYLVFSSDLVLRIFTDSRSNFVEVDYLPCLTTTLCLIYNKEEDVVYSGGIGFMEEWKIHGAEHAASIVPGRKFLTDLSRNDWVRDIKIVKQNNIIIGQHGNGLCVVHTKTGKQLHRLPNRHEGPLKCCCYYRPNDFLITGGADGKIKFYNGTAFNLLHVIIGHHGPVTDLEPHSKDTLLFSSSHDGTIRIWRLDTQQIFMRLDIGEKIYRMSLLGDHEFYFQTEKNVVVYSLNQFYEFFSGVESETKILLCCKGKGRPNKILGSAEDGSIRLMSPVTGLTLTIIYPMPSFQVLSSFAYDLHQERLHTVLADGKVLVYNTATNPCKAEEVWAPKCEDDRVNIILLITLEFPGDDGTDIDNLVFAGLITGQIILCDSLVCSLENPLQAHEGAIICLERSHCGSNKSLIRSECQIISGGTDKFVKIWRVSTYDIKSKKPIIELLPLVKIYLLSIPIHVCMYSSLLWVAVESSYYNAKRWRLLLFDVMDLCNVEKRSMKSPLQLTHPEDEDHYLEMTSLNRCSTMNVVMTSGKDGYVKIWSCRNELLREMNFDTPIYASCFANEHGDILVGYGTHICSISLLTYLPLDYLKQVLEGGYLDLKDDIREPPVKFDPISQPWLELNNVKQYSTDLAERRGERLEEEVIEKLKKTLAKDAAHKFVIFVDGNTTKVIRKDLADKLLTWAKGKIKLKVTKPVEFNPFLENVGKSPTETTKQSACDVKDDQVGKQDKDLERTSVNEDNTYLDKQGVIQIYPSTVGEAIRHLDNQRVLGPIEMRLMKETELLKREPIIAPDGYIPNSVIRGRIKPKKYEHEIPVKKVAEKPFKLKPVPKVNPHHMPSWWGQEEETATTVSTLEYRVMKWDDTPSPTPRSIASAASSVSLESLIESPVKKYIAEGRGKTTSPKATKSKSSPKITPVSVLKNRSDMTPVESIKQMSKLNDKNLVKQKSDWDDLTPEAESRRSQYKGYTMLDLGPSDTNISDDISGQGKLTPKFKAGTPTMYKLVSPSMLVLTPIASMKAEATSDISRVSSGTLTSVKSKRLEMARYDLEMGTPDSMRKGRRSGAKSGQKEKSFKLTNYAVDEDSSAIRPKETKSGRRTRGQSIIKQLMEESWMPSIDGDYDDDDVFKKLISVLDNDNPVIYESVCNYLTNIFSELGLGDDLLDDALGRLGNNLHHANTAIRKYSIKTMQVLGQGRTDILPLLLPKLVDPEEPIRKSAAKAIQLLTGATSKETLLNVLEEMGIVTSKYYSSKEDEELAFAMLAERFAEPDDPLLFDRIQNWVEGTTPGLYEDDRDDDLPSWSRKESSFMSEGGKSGKKESPVTPRSRGTGFKKKLPDIDGFSTVSERSSSSRRSRGSASISSLDEEFFQPNKSTTPALCKSGKRSSSRKESSRNTSRSAFHSRSSSEPGILLPFDTSPERARDKPLKKTSKLSKDKSMKENLDESAGSSKRKPVSKGPAKPKGLKKEPSHALENESTKGSLKGKSAKGKRGLDKKRKDGLKKAKSEVINENADISMDNAITSMVTNSMSNKASADLVNATDGSVTADDHVAMATIDEDKEPTTEQDMSDNVDTVNGTNKDGSKRHNTSLLRLESVREMTSPEQPALDIRFTPRDPKLYKYYNSQHHDEISRKRFHRYTFAVHEKTSTSLMFIPLLVILEETDEDITQKDSDYRTMSDVTNSQINDRLSGFDSGITHDASEYSHGRHYGKEQGQPLSPVKSEPTSPSPKSTKDWRKFFDLVPTAHERKQMEQIRKEMEAGKLRHTTLPPITYFAEDLPMLPGEAGTRLLQTVRIGEKMQLPGDGRHRIESVPGKLQVHTQNEDAGLSNFGILQMQWTTGVPTVKDRLQPPQRIPQYRNQNMIRSEPSSNASLHRRQQMVSEDEELHLPFIGSNTPSEMSGHSGNHYEWEYPLPPPPAKESRTCIPHIRRDHESYCKYYNLIKKKLHLYTSQQREKTHTLPEVFVKRLREPDDSGKPMTRSHDRLNRKRTLTKTDMKSSFMFPPIKLGQLVKIF